jgi:hypothetical protein
MDIEKIITLVLAIYGALLSTILGIREIAKERRKIAIFLEFKQWSGIFSIIITNVGHRPITLVDISMQLPPHGENLPRGLLREIKDPFPITLDDGEHLNLELSLHTSSFINPFEKKKNIKIIVYDSEGRKYNNFKMLYHNEKYGTHNSKIN